MTEKDKPNTSQNRNGLAAPIPMEIYPKCTRVHDAINEEVDKIEHIVAIETHHLMSSRSMERIDLMKKDTSTREINNGGVKKSQSFERQSTQGGVSLYEDTVDYKSSIMQRYNSKSAQLCLLVSLFIALFISDLFILTDISDAANPALYSILFAVLIVFTMELLVCSVCDQGYLWSFFFFADLIGTLSLILEIPWIMEAGTVDDAADNADSSVLRVSRTSRVGARASRIVRMYRVIKLLKLFKLVRFTVKLEHRQTEALLRETKDEEEAGLTSEKRVSRFSIRGMSSFVLGPKHKNDDKNVVGSQGSLQVMTLLQDAVSRSVAAHVLVIAILIPFLSYDHSPEAEISGAEVTGSPYFAAFVNMEMLAVAATGANWSQLNNFYAGSKPSAYYYQTEYAQSRGSMWLTHFAGEPNKNATVATWSGRWSEYPPVSTPAHAKLYISQLPQRSQQRSPSFTLPFMFEVLSQGAAGIFFTAKMLQEPALELSMPVQIPLPMPMTPFHVNVGPTNEAKCSDAEYTYTHSGEYLYPQDPHEAYPTMITSLVPQENSYNSLHHNRTVATKANCGIRLLVPSVTVCTQLNTESVHLRKRSRVLEVRSSQITTESEDAMKLHGSLALTLRWRRECAYRVRRQQNLQVFKGPRGSRLVCDITAWRRWMALFDIGVVIFIVVMLLSTSLSLTSIINHKIVMPLERIFTTLNDTMDSLRGKLGAFVSSKGHRASTAANLQKIRAFQTELEPADETTMQGLEKLITKLSRLVKISELPGKQADAMAGVMSHMRGVDNKMLGFLRNQYARAELPDTHLTKNQAILTPEITSRRAVRMKSFAVSHPSSRQRSSSTTNMPEEENPIKIHRRPLHHSLRVGKAQDHIPLSTCDPEDVLNDERTDKVALEGGDKDRLQHRALTSPIRTTMEKPTVVEDAANLEDYSKMLSDWSYDPRTHSKEVLVDHCYFVLLYSHCLADFYIAHDVAIQFLHEVIFNGYSDENPYHNCFHGVDVMVSFHMLLRMIDGADIFSQLDIFAGLVGALAHDMGHIGVTNNFLIQTQHPLALTYNDQSPLENFHISNLYTLLKKSDGSTNIFSTLSRSQWNSVRSLIVRSILSTDMQMHFKMVNEIQVFYDLHETQLSRARLKNSSRSRAAICGTREESVFLIGVLMHGADLSNGAKPWPLFDALTELITEEFFAQGEAEAKHGLTVTPMFDRKNTSVPKCQIGFLDFVVGPLYAGIMKMFPSKTGILGKHLVENRKRFSEKWLQELSTEEYAQAALKSASDQAAFEKTFLKLEGQGESEPKRASAITAGDRNASASENSSLGWRKISNSVLGRRCSQGAPDSGGNKTRVNRSPSHYLISPNLSQFERNLRASRSISVHDIIGRSKSRKKVRVHANSGTGNEASSQE